MKIHRFYVKQIELGDAEMSITDVDIISQMRNVLRLREGDSVCLFDGSGKEYFGKVKIILKSKSIFSKENIKSYPQDIHHTNLYFSLLKKDKTEWVIQKAVELGVSKLVPIISERTEKINLNKERAMKIITEAVEQSGRVHIPLIHSPVKIEEIVSQLDKEGINKENTFYLDFCQNPLNLTSLSNQKTLNIFVGPEGGWSEKDRQIFEKSKIPARTLGHFVLRGETASVAILSAITILRNDSDFKNKDSKK